MTDVERSLWRAWEERRDGEAFERLVRPHLRFLSDFARRAGCPGADADDAVQTALVELAQARGRPERVPIRAWLGRSVLQQAQMRRRARERRERHEAAAARPERVDPRPSAHDEVERALARLDPDARLAVELRYLHDLDYREVAHILRTSELGCRLRVHRAIARLRKELGVLAPAMVAALPLFGGAREARAELARNAAAAAGTVLVGGLLMATTLKIAAVAALVLAALLLWRREAPEAPPRSTQERRAVAETPQIAEEPTAAGASGREGASGAATEPDDAEPPLAPGNGCVRGVVRFEDGEPLAGVRVSLWGSSKIYATTDAQGRFHLHDDWVAGRAVYLAGPNGVNGADPFGFLLGPEVRMVEGETVRVEIVLKRGTRVAAQVLSAATGEPVAGAHIELRRWDGDQLTHGLQGDYGHMRTDAAGRFAFDHVVPADYSLAISAKGFEAQYAHWDLRERPLPEEFRLAPARRLEIRVRNAPPVAVGTEVRWCIQLSHFKEGRVVPKQEFFMLDAEAVMEEGGLLVGDAPPPGRYDLTIWRTDVLPQTERKEIALGDAPVETLTVEVAPGSPVEGTVRLPDGTPVGDAEVWAGGIRARTDEGGRFAFGWLPGAVAGASKKFTVRLEGSDLPMGEKTFGPGEPRVVDLVLPGKGSVRFELKGAEADNFGGIDVRRAGEKDPVVTRRIDRPPTDAVVLRGLPPGPLSLQIWQMGRSWIRREIRVDGEAVDLGVLEFPDWPRPEILVRVPAGKTMLPWIFLWQEDGPPVGTLRVELDKDGRGSLPPQPPGPRRASVRGPFGEPVVVEFTVDPERPRPVEVLLDPGY